MSYDYDLAQQSIDTLLSRRNYDTQKLEAELQRRHRTLRAESTQASADVQQSQHIIAHAAIDARCWEASGDAVAALPVDASDRDIVVAQIRAVAAVKRAVVAELKAEMPKLLARESDLQDQLNALKAVSP